MNSKLLAAAAAALSLTAVSAHAGPTVVATISGAYDVCSGDTPCLVIHNSSGGVLHNATLDLIGYQGLNNGLHAHISLGDLAAGDTQEVWGSLPGGGAFGVVTPGDLTSWDYDDSYGGTAFTVNDPNCALGTFYCAYVGNFRVVFNATVMGGTFDGQAVGSSFSPSSNATGGFVGWEGLDPNGLSETSAWDVHSGSVSGTLAVITLGAAGVPEPATWAMMLLGVGALGAALRRRQAVAA